MTPVTDMETTTYQVHETSSGRLVLQEEGLKSLGAAIKFASRFQHWLVISVHTGRCITKVVVARGSKDKTGD